MLNSTLKIVWEGTEEVVAWHTTEPTTTYSALRSLITLRAPYRFLRIETLMAPIRMTVPVGYAQEYDLQVQDSNGTVWLRSHRCQPTARALEIRTWAGSPHLCVRNWIVLTLVGCRAPTASDVTEAVGAVTLPRGASYAALREQIRTQLDDVASGFDFAWLSDAWQDPSVHSHTVEDEASPVLSSLMLTPFTGVVFIRPRARHCVLA